VSADRMPDPLAAWQAMLDRQEQYFGRVRQGRIGIVSLETFASPPGAMLVWEMVAGKAIAGEGRFHRLQEGGCDLLLVFGDEELLRDPAPLQPDPFAALRRLIRRGEILFFVPAGREDLLARGFEDLVDALGVPFLGTCH